jgi:hypothetical protein
MAKKTIETLRAALRAALLSGEEASTLRAEIDAAERARRNEDQALARAEEELKSAANAEIQREARRRAEASAAHLQTLISALD